MLGRDLGGTYPMQNKLEHHPHGVLSPVREYKNINNIKLTITMWSTKKIHTHAPTHTHTQQQQTEP